MAININKIIIGGRLTRDPELKTTSTGVSVCNFSVAVGRKAARDEERITDFFDCVAWRGTAETVARYFKKGSSIVVDGSVRKRTWESKDGKEHSAIEVQVNDITFVDSKNDKPEQPQFEDITDAPSFDEVQGAKLEEADPGEELPF